MFRLHREDTSLTTTLRLAGRLDGQHVPAIAAVLDEPVAAGRQLVIDLADLQFVDAVGLRCLRRAHRAGARLLHGTTFVRHLLETDA